MSKSFRTDGQREAIHHSDPLEDAREHPMAKALREESQSMANERLRRLMQAAR